MDQHEERALDNIKLHGCHVLQIMEEDDFPPFSYSIGIRTNYQKPDLCIMGLHRDVALFAINEYAHYLKEGKTFEIGQLYSGFLEGFDICFENVAKKHFRKYFGWGLWYYGEQHFDVWQLVYPTTSGIYPWYENVPEEFLKDQTILTETGRCTIL